MCERKAVEKGCRQESTNITSISFTLLRYEFFMDLK